uniref:Putative secreted protein n=1 Tax=Anopheles darlingi TaxID=43151 RepID=A0A2M4DQ88_ANODA
MCSPALASSLNAAPLTTLCSALAIEREKERALVCVYVSCTQQSRPSSRILHRGWCVPTEWNVTTRGGHRTPEHSSTCTCHERVLQKY